MPLAETAQLLVKLTLQDDASGTANKVKTSLGDMGKVALGVAGAAGFGALTKGALDAEAAQGKFMAATGKSRDEAKLFVSDMNDLAGTAGAVGLSFEEIAETGTMVEQQFGTTGEKTQELTGYILDFAKVSGLDATEAAADLEDTLSAMGLSAEDAQGFMDQLIASNQTFGTDIGDSLSTIQSMAPALQAMGLELDDGVALLNAFEVAGVDAGSAQRGLQTAIKDLKPGQNLDDLIAQIGAIEDPTKRAQKAIELFGTKAGTGLAQVIKPGMTSLDDFAISAEEASGKTSKAAEDMLTFGDKIRGFVDKAMAGARELGQEFGPAITGLASLGSLAAPLATGLGDVIKNVAAKILPQATAAAAARGTAEAAAEAAAMQAASAGSAGGVAATAGTALGVGFGAAALVAIQHGLPALGSVIAEKIAGTDAESQARSAGQQLAEQLLQGASDEAKAHFVDTFMAGVQGGKSLDEAARAAMTEAGANASGAFAESAAAHIADDQREAGVAQNFATSFANDTALKNAGIDGASVIANSPAWTQAGNVAAGSTTDAFYAYWSRQGVSTVKNAAGDAAKAFSQEVLSNRGDAQSAWKAFVDMMKNPLDTAAEIAELKGDLASKKMIKGLNSNDPQVKQWAENTRDAIQSRINDLEQLLGQDGTDAGQALADHLQNQAGAAGAAAAAIMRRIEAALHDVRVNVDVHQDPGHVPGGGRAEGGPVKKGIAYIVGEKRPELFIPEANGTIIPRLPPMSVPHPYTGGGGVQMPPVVVNLAPPRVSARETSTTISHFQVLQGSRLPVSRV